MKILNIYNCHSISNVKKGFKALFGIDKHIYEKKSPLKSQEYKNL